MKSLLAPGDQIFADTLKAGQILDESYDPPAGQPGKNVKLSLRVEFVAFYAANKDLTELSRRGTERSLSEGFIPAREPLKLESLNAQQTDDRGVTRWSVRVSRQLQKNGYQ